MNFKSEVQKMADAIKEKLNITEQIAPADFDTLIEFIDSGLKINKDKAILKEYKPLLNSNLEVGDFVQKIKTYFYKKEQFNLQENIVNYKIVDNDFILYNTQEGILYLLNIKNNKKFLLDTDIQSFQNVIYRKNIYETEDNILGFNSNKGFSLILFNKDTIKTDFIKSGYELLDIQDMILVLKELSTNLIYVYNYFYSTYRNELFLSEDKTLIDILLNQYLTNIKIDNNNYILFYVNNNNDLYYVLYQDDLKINNIDKINNYNIENAQLSKILYYDNKIKLYFILNSQLYCYQYNYNKIEHKIDSLEIFLYDIQAQINNLIDIYWLEKENIISIIYKDYKEDYYYTVLFDENKKEIIDKVVLLEIDNKNYQFNKNNVSYLDNQSIINYNFLLNQAEYQVTTLKYPEDKTTGIIDLVTKNNIIRVYEPKKEDKK